MKLTLALNTNTVIADTMAAGSPTFTDEPLRTIILLLDDDEWERMGKPTSITVDVAIANLTTATTLYTDGDVLGTQLNWRSDVE